MNRKFIITAAITLMALSLYSQNATQQHANTLLPPRTFLSFVGDLNTSEETLLKWDFTLSDITEKDGKKNYQYRLDHTLDQNTGLYMFDIFSIEVDDSEFIVMDKFLYLTNKPSNFTGYKDKLIDFGFEWVPDPGYYAMEINGELYLLKTGRAMHSSGTPNYMIEITRLRDLGDD